MNEDMDQKTREKIILSDKNCFVLAGAGTGKSTLIAQKIVYCIENEFIKQMSKVYAITYTRKAAAELLWKIEEEIIKKANQNNLEINKKQTLLNSLETLDEMYVGTIHGFCVKILKNFPAEAGVDPVFKVIDEDEKRFLFDDIFYNYYEENINNYTNKIISNIWDKLLTLEEEINIEKIKENLIRFQEKYYLLERLKENDFFIKDEKEMMNAIQNSFEYHVQIFKKLINNYDYKLEHETSSNDNSLGSLIVEILNILNQDISWDELEIYTSSLPSVSNMGKVKYIINKKSADEDKNYLNELRSYCKLMSGRYDLFQKDLEKNANLEIYLNKKPFYMHAYSSKIIENEYKRYLWHKIVQDFESYFSSRKKLLGILDYQDLLQLTQKLIMKKEFIQSVREQIDYLFVDEYQDTDPLQSEIFNTIELNLKNKNNIHLFLVGDEKQSIYRFRGADVEAFLWQKKYFEENNRALIESLIINRRSCEPILNFVNTIFSEKKTNQSNLSIKNYRPIYCGIKNQNNLKNKGVYISFIDNKMYDENNLKISELRKFEAKVIADEIEKIIKLNTEKLSIALLFQALTSTEEYIIALKNKNLPVTISGRTHYTYMKSVKYFEMLLRFIANRHDLISLTGFLRSPFVRLSDSDIQKLSNLNLLQSLARGLLIEEEIKHEYFNNTLNEFSVKISKLLKLLDSIPIHDFLIATFEEFSFFETAKLHEEPEEIQTVFLKILKTSKSLENYTNISSNNLSSRNLLLKLADEIKNYEGLVIETEEINSEKTKSSNFIQIMSIHKSKGLEFDIVFMPDLFRKSRANLPDFTIEPVYEKNKIYSEFENSKTFNFSFFRNEEDFKQRVKTKEENEAVHLMYTAMTRAKLRLYFFIPYENIKISDSCLLQKLLNSLEDKTNLFNEIYTQITDNFREFKISGINNLGFSAFLNQINYNTIQDKEKDKKYPDKIKESSKKIFYKSLPITKYKSIKITTPSFLITKDNSNNFLLNTEQNEDISLANRQNSLRSLFQKQKLNAKLKGIVIHQILELIDLKNPIWENSIKKIIINKNFFNKEIESFLDKIAYETIETYKKSSLYDFLKTSKISGKEIPFSYKIKDSDELFIGYIDLIFENDSKVFLIDYKSDSIPANKSKDIFEKEILQKYKVSIDIYKKAAEVFFHKKDIQAGVYHTPTGNLFFYL
ncbi:MAG: UvrD-helicase domain-containing protein [Spirochaetia bacterium]|nr:UvrD-helicase domain-containing protein [Spirochaetia bacterium]